MKSHFLFFVVALLISFFVQSIPTILDMAGGREALFGSLVLIIISIAIAGLKELIDLGFIRIALQLNDNQPVQLSILFSQYQVFIKYLLASIVYGLIIVGGFILLIIPGIIFSIRFQYYSYLIVDKGLGPIEALRQSWRMTKGNVWNLFLLGVLLGLINLGGALLLIVGLLATIPATMVAQAFVFRKLQAVSTPASVSNVQTSPAPAASA